MAPERELPLLIDSDSESDDEPPSPVFDDSDSESDDEPPSLVDDDSEYELCDEHVVRERVPLRVPPFEVFILFYSFFSYCKSAYLFVL